VLAEKSTANAKRTDTNEKRFINPSMSHTMALPTIICTKL
jgi:hypothetical protein